MEDLDVKIIEQKQRLGYTYSELAKVSGVSRPTIRRLLKLGASYSNLDTVLRVTDILKIKFHTTVEE